jgi:aryl-alcohol dehydrogenase-like predicted oxidoreductase
METNLMTKRPLGKTPRLVHPVGLGCMGLSWAYHEEAIEESEGVRLIQRAIELGVDHFDTSDAYGPHTNEILVGRAIGGAREKVVVATKAGLLMKGTTARDGYSRNGRPEYIRAACEGSLSRLKIDVIDLYYLHRIDPATPVEDSWGGMSRLVSEGKVRWLGISEPKVPDLERVSRIHPVTAVQSELSLWTREYLDDVVPWCAANGASFVAFSPLGRGFLTGKFSAEARFTGGDFRASLPRFTPEAIAANQRIVDAVRAVADRRGVTPAQIALAWVLAQGEHVLSIPGTRTQKYLEQNVAAADLTLTEEELAELDAIPAPVGGRY